MHTQPPSHSTSTGPSSGIDPPHVQAEQPVGLPAEPAGRPKRISKAPPCGTGGHKHGHNAGPEASDEGHARPPPHYTRQRKVRIALERRRFLKNAITTVQQQAMWSNVAHEMTVEEEIHELLLSFAEAGATVVRLKGGDPLVFGRGGEEMDFLQQQGIQVKVIPGCCNQPSATVITAVVSAWSFLLTTMTGLKLNPKHWQESISYLSSLLDKDDQSVRIAAGEALALIFEIGSVEKFSGEVKGSIDVSTPEGSKNREGFSHVQGLKGKIMNKVRDLSAEAGDKGSAKKDLNSQRNLFRDILDFFES
ncbi:hypothetical protein CMV_010642 [Castanea mollissima]|uniref:Interferon-related developmental regulator N-terminal domain-containing protein n=1 Tax=Castanea mollissima TaxID=60419 RepID=A0A8J4R561_9ROSI|nr:hypothetical protein CMV_010642 [Castanea mollissima]